MFRAGVSVTAILQLNSMKMKLLQKVCGKLTCLQQLTGSVRWRSSVRPAPLLTATPVRTLVDEKISIKGRFLPPHCPVTVYTRMHSDEGDLWESFVHYNTEATGTFSLTSDRSVGGSYLGCEPMGVFWGMKPAPGERDGLRQLKMYSEKDKKAMLYSSSYVHSAHLLDICWMTIRLRKKDVETPYVVHISLLEGHVSPREAQTTELAAITAERWYLAPGVKRMEIRQNGIVGTLFIPPGPGPFPAMLDLWGLGGGLQEYRSSLFASKGFVSFSLAYIGHKDLPGPPNCVNVGDSYFKAAFQLLQNHHQVVSDRIGIIGLSFGCYLTLRIAALTGVKPSCLIGINGPVGSTVTPFDAGGSTKLIDNIEKYCTYNEQGYIIFKEASLLANLPPDSIVKVEKIDCPLMYVVGEDDLSASSIENADMIEESLKAAGKSHLFTRLSYPGAGHLIEPPYAPSVRASMWSVKPKKLITMWGGHPAPHAAAEEDAWEKILDFMDKHLRC